MSEKAASEAHESLQAVKPIITFDRLKSLPWTKQMNLYSRIQQLIESCVFAYCGFLASLLTRYFLQVKKGLHQEVRSQHG